MVDPYSPRHFKSRGEKEFFPHKPLLNRTYKMPSLLIFCWFTSCSFTRLVSYMTTWTSPYTNVLVKMCFMMITWKPFGSEWPLCWPPSFLQSYFCFSLVWYNTFHATCICLMFTVLFLLTCWLIFSAVVFVDIKWITFICEYKTRLTIPSLDIEMVCICQWEVLHASDETIRRADGLVPCTSTSYENVECRYPEEKWFTCDK